MAANAHPTAIVEDGSTIGDGTRVWHHAHVRAGARVGTGCTIGKNVYVDSGVVLGDRVKVQNNVSLYDGVTVGDDVFLGPSCVFTNDLYPRAASEHWTITPTHVADGASIGANATVVCGVTIGSYAMVAAGSVVTHDVADHALVLGNPAHHHAWVCRQGHIVSREADPPADPDDCPQCRQETG